MAQIAITLSHLALRGVNDELVLELGKETVYSKFARVIEFCAIADLLLAGVAKNLLHPFKIDIREKETAFIADYTQTVNPERTELINEIVQQFGGYSFIKVDITEE